MNWICEHPLRDLYVLGKHILKCLWCFSSFSSKFLNVNVQKVPVSFKCLWGVLSFLGFLWFSMQFYIKVFLKHFESFPVNYFWPSGILWSIIFCNWNIFSMILARLIFQNHREPLLKQMEKVINSWRGGWTSYEWYSVLDPLLLISSPSISFCAENWKPGGFFSLFFEEGVGTEEGREHPFGFMFQEFIFSSGRQKEKSLLTWLFHNLALL